MAEEGPLLSAVSGLIAQASDTSLYSVTPQTRDIDKKRLLLQQLLVKMKLRVLPIAELKADKDPVVRKWVEKFIPTVNRARDVLNKINLSTRSTSENGQPELRTDLNDVVDEIFQLAKQLPVKHLKDEESRDEIDEREKKSLLNNDERDLEAGNGQVPAADDHQFEQQKRCSKYSTKALGFALTTLVAYLGSASSSSGNVFKVAMAAYIIAVAVDLVSATKMKPTWGSSALVYVSSFLLMLVSYLLLVTFNKAYAYAIFPVLLLLTVPIVFAFNQRKQRRAGQRRRGNNDEADGEELDRIFELSAGIVNGGGLITMILGHYMVRPNHHVSAVGFLFFFTVVLGLYLMMATTVRTAALTHHARNLAYLQMAFLIGTIIAILSYGSFPR